MVADGDAWRVETLGTEKVMRCASFRWAIHRAGHACERDNGVLFARIPRTEGDRNAHDGDTTGRHAGCDTFGDAVLDLGVAQVEPDRRDGRGEHEGPAQRS